MDETLIRVPNPLSSLQAPFGPFLLVVETRMLLLLLLLLLVGAVFAVLLWAGTLWLQGYIYNEPAEGLAWRAPAAGAALMVFLAVWCFLNYRLGEPGTGELPFDTWWNFSPSETYPAKPWPHFWSVKGGREIEYVRRGTGARGGSTQYQYVDPLTNQPWSRESGGLVDAVIVEDNGEKTTFKLDLPGGKFKAGESARYVEEGGRHRVLTEENVQRGQLTRFRSGLLLSYVVLNVLFLIVWFVCVWLLLRFQWPHALGLAVVLWLGVMLAIFPLLTARTRVAVDAKPVVKPTAALLPWSNSHLAG
jgi:hypothetical protein